MNEPLRTSISYATEVSLMKSSINTVKKVTVYNTVTRNKKRLMLQDKGAMPVLTAVINEFVKPTNNFVSMFTRLMLMAGEIK